MSEPAQRCENYAIFKQNYTPELFIAFKMVYSCCFSLGGNLDFPEFLQKKFYNINYRLKISHKFPSWRMKTRVLSYMEYINLYLEGGAPLRETKARSFKK